MVSFLYHKGIQELGQGGSIDFLADDLRLALVTGEYLPCPVEHEYYSHLYGEASGSGYSAGGQLLAGRSISPAGSYHAQPLTWPRVTLAGIRAALLYQDSGDPGSSLLIAYMQLEQELFLYGQDLTLGWGSGGLLCLGAQRQDVFIKQIIASSDDGYGNFFYNTASLRVIGSTDAWLRFANVALPREAVVDDARLILCADANNSGAARFMQLHCNDEDDALAPLNAAEHAAKSRTPAFSLWAGEGNWLLGQEYTSPDFSAALQQVLLRPGWQAGNAIMVLLDYIAGGGSNNRTAYAFDGLPTRCARLQVEYHVEQDIACQPMCAFLDTRCKLRAAPRRLQLAAKVREYR